LTNLFPHFFAENSEVLLASTLYPDEEFLVWFEDATEFFLLFDFLTL